MTNNPYFGDRVEPIPPPGGSDERKPPLPFFLQLVFVLTFVPWLFGNKVIAGLQVTGWAWFVMLGASVLTLLAVKRIRFPVLFWLPWAVCIGINFIFRRGFPDAVQSTAQMVCPFFVGVTVSGLSLGRADAERMVSWLLALAVVVWVLLFIKLPMVLSGALPQHGTMTPEAITCTLLAGIYAAFYATGMPGSLVRYLSVAVVPVLLLTRGPLLAAMSAMAFTPGPLPSRKRALVAAVLLAGGLVVFYTPRMQGIMFMSGEGTIEEVRYDNPNLALSGRKALWQTLWDECKQAPLFGYGINASRAVLLREFDELIYLPHNDWLRVLHDFGIVGVACYVLGVGLQFVFLLRIAARLPPSVKPLAYAGAGAFVPYVAIMFTDNVTLYVQYFGNLHFAVIGVIYAVAARIEREEAESLAFGREPLLAEAIRDAEIA